MSIRFEKPFRVGMEPLRAQLRDSERMLFDFLCAAGQLGYRLPDDKINLAAAAGRKDPRQRLTAEFPHHSRQRNGSDPNWAEASEQLRRRLLRELKVEPISEQRRALRILLAYATIALAPDLKLPRDPASRAAWETAVKLFARLFPSRVRAMGALEPVLSRLAVLRRETAGGMKIGRIASGQRPGREGRKLAVDSTLIAAVGNALGKKLIPGYMARYLFYTKPGDHIWPHPDDPRFDVTLLICVSHELPRGHSKRSAFLAYRPDGSVKRYELTPGSALAVEPGLIHAREPVRQGERVALLSIGLCRAS